MNLRTDVLFPIRVLALSAACAGSVAAQAILPASLDGVEGGAGSIIPFGLTGPVRYMCLYDVDQLPFSGPRMIQEVRFRADGTTSPIQGKQFLRIDVWVSTTSRSSDEASTDFEENHGTDRTLVVSDYSLALPAQPALAAGAGPRPANIVIPFDEPFYYGTSPFRDATPPNGFVVDLQIRQQPSGSYRLDSPFTCDSGITDVGLPGGACTLGAGLGGAPVMATSNDIRAGGSVSWRIAPVPPDGMFFVFVAFDLTGFWLAFDQVGTILPLPAPLHPSAAGCTVFVRPDLFQFPGVADSAGIGQVGLSIPPNRDFVGLTLYAQALVTDITANPFGFVSTNAQSATVCGPLGCARIYNIGNATATSGTVTFGAASVIELR